MTSERLIALRACLDGEERARCLALLGSLYAGDLALLASTLGLDPAELSALRERDTGLARLTPCSWEELRAYARRDPSAGRALLDRWSESVSGTARRMGVSRESVSRLRRKLGCRDRGPCAAKEYLRS